MRNHFFMALALGLCGVLAVGCSDSDLLNDDTHAADAGRPVTFSKFSPAEGPARTHLFIYGDNFGTDPSKIKVTVGGQDAKVVSSTGDIIMAQVKKNSFHKVIGSDQQDYQSEITVGVTGEDGKQIADYTFGDKFTYQATKQVGTLVRNVDEKGNSVYSEGYYGVDGGTGSLACSDWLVFDPKWKEGDDRVLFSTNWTDGFWSINLDKKYIKRQFPRTQYTSMRSFTFTQDGDTILFADVNNENESFNKPNIYYATRSEDFSKLHTYCYGPGASSIVQMPDGTKFYAAEPGSSVWRMGPNTNEEGGLPFDDDERVQMFDMTKYITGNQSLGWNPALMMIMHPSGKYVYITSCDIFGVFRCDYNPKTHELESPVLVAGTASSLESGCKEGTGNGARFTRPWSGFFAKNNDYVVNPRPDGDEYDFYLTAMEGNDCIWKITPDGVATIAAGRSNESQDGKTTGFVDGDPLKEARLDQPKGLAYDVNTDTFYFYDYTYHALRYMTVE